MANTIISPPKISVLMSVFNGDKWLEKSIPSILNQSFQDFEFIIVNDGSTDNSLAIIESWKAKDSRIVLFNKINTGLTDSLNYGLKMARGEWVARQDADDVAYFDRLQQQFDYVTNTSGIILLGAGFKLIDEVGEKGRNYHLPTRDFDLVKYLISGKRFFPHSSAFYKTDVVRKLGGYRCRFKRSQDRDLWLRLVAKGGISCVNKPLVYIRKHSEQVSHEDLGRRQLTDSAMAMVSYWIRKFNCEDPVNFSDKDFNMFRLWLVDRLEVHGIYAQRELIEEVKSLFAKKEVCSMLKTLWFRREKILGYFFYSKTVYKKIALEWCAMNKIEKLR